MLIDMIYGSSPEPLTVAGVEVGPRKLSPKNAQEKAEMGLELWGGGSYG